MGISGDKQEVKKESFHLLVESSSFSPKGFTYVVFSLDTLNDEFLREYSKYFPMLDKIFLIDSQEARQLKSRLQTSIESIHLSGEQESHTNISVSTENGSISKGRKPPIAYYQFYRLPKEHKKSEVEAYMRRMAA